MSEKISCPAASTSFIAPLSTPPSPSVQYLTSQFISEPSLSTPSTIIVQENNMLPPPEVEYSTREQFEDAVQTFARGQGYAVTIKSSIAGKRVYLKCDRGALNVNKLGEERQRQTSSRRIGCPFLLSGNFSKRRGNWKLNFLECSHNRDLSLHPSGHSTHRNLTSTQADTVKKMTLAGTNAGALVNLSTLYNGRVNVRKEILHMRTPIQALFDDLQAFEFLHFHRCDENETITSFFFANKECVRLARQYHRVALMNCKYKRNKYRLPLRHIVGTTSSNSHFSVGFCFLKEEKKKDYTWALSKLATIWTPEMRPAVIVTDRELAVMTSIAKAISSSSHLLCIWHINKNILAKCKRQFETSEEWTAFLQPCCILVEANTEVEYEKLWKELSDSFKTKPKVLEYLANDWLIYKERFVNAWTSKYLYFGNKATSSVEGAHAYVEKFLQVSTGDLLSVLNKLTLALEHQKHQVTEVIIVGVYVDDFPVAASPADLVGDFFDAMGKLSIKYLVKVWKFLGMRAELSGEDGYMLNQQAAIEELPQQHGLWTRTACVPNAT
uniref:Pc21g00130 putative n=1 Tax=Albugo laibachii Nc14 TaxID=890382 RepID=F0WI88_9STRA|nr:Pc21g00130 putative [Albugo laibachii Nc14]|eukprot:CCA20967.1 Pc21g00130 putative [Albugo laibachii Nc14]